MALLTREFLSSIGVELDDHSYELLAGHFETTLQDRVINEIVQELSPEQATELARLHATNDDNLHAWLQQNVPELSDIVADEVDILLGEIAEDSEKF